MQIKRKILLLTISLFLLINGAGIILPWLNRQLPPEPDDSGVFLTLINLHSKEKNIFRSQNKVLDQAFYWDETGGVDKSSYFFWAFFWGKIKRIFSLTAETGLRLSFYFGTALFLFSALYFFKEEKNNFKALLILGLAFFTGEGSYHGLFWPAPSLYSASLFLIIFKLCLGEERWGIVKTLLLLFALLLIHPLGLIWLFSMLFFIFFYKRSSLFKIKKIRLGAIFVFGLIFNFGWQNFLENQGVSLINQSNLINYIFNKINSQGLIFSLSSAQVIFNQYFLILMTRPFFLTLLILGLIKARQKNTKLATLYLSTLPLLISGLFFEGGAKVLLLIWILTFFLFAYGFEAVYELGKKFKQNKLLLRKEKRLFFLLIINILLQLAFALWLLKPISLKNIVLKPYLIFSGFLLLLLFLLGFIKRKFIFWFGFLAGACFFIYLGFEKTAMLVFQQQRNNFAFNKEAFFSQIDPKKKGPIIYNDNMSFSVFSGSGLIERKAVKIGFLNDDDLAEASYFISLKKRFSSCEKDCYLRAQKEERKLELRAGDENFVLYELN